MYPMMTNMVQQGGIYTTNPYLLQATSHTNANTKGSWQEMIPSTYFDAAGMFAILSYADFTYDYLVDIGIGSAGNEQVIVPNMMKGGTMYSSRFNENPINIPMFIPASSRISFRCQCSTGSKPIRLQVVLYAFSGTPFFIGRVKDYGTNTGDSGGTSVDPGGSANTFGNYSEITASTDFDARGFWIGFGNKANAARTTADWRVNIAIGGSGNEQIIIPNYHICAQASGCSLSQVNTPIFWFPIPAGTRIAANAMCDITDATDRTFDIAAYLVA